MLKVDQTSRELGGIQIIFAGGESPMVQSEGLFGADLVTISLNQVSAISIAMNDALAIKGMRFYDRNQNLLT